MRTCIPTASGSRSSRRASSARRGCSPTPAPSPPPGLGTTTPKKVAKAVARAIRRNRNEITVAPRRQRFLTEVGYRHPEVAARIQRRGGAERMADELAAGQADKR